MANSIWRARTRDRLVVLTGEEVRCEGEERVWLVTVHWVLVYGGKRDLPWPTSEGSLHVPPSFQARSAGKSN